MKELYAEFVIAHNAMTAIHIKMTEAIRDLTLKDVEGLVLGKGSDYANAEKEARDSFNAEAKTLEAACRELYNKIKDGTGK
jgi:hypothetical protein